MSQTELDQLINQLSNDDAKLRQDAAKRLGDLAQPEAIPELAHSYEKDEDEGVRKAAADALRKFRRLEQASLNGAGGVSANPLRRVRTLLVILLIVTIGANVAIAAPGLLARFAPAPTAQTVPTERPALVEGLAKRITAIRGMAVLLQGGFRDLQTMGTQALINDKPICAQLKANEVNQDNLSELDARTYPDLPAISDLINGAALQAMGLRANYLLVCDAKLSAADLAKQLDKLGGAANLVMDADSINSKYLGDATNKLQNAKDHPAPTVGPTLTPTETATTTPVIPTTQPAGTGAQAGATAAPAAASATGGAAASLPTQGTQPATATATATITPTATVTPLPSITFNGFRLDTLTSFQASLSLQADGKYMNGQSFSSSLQITALQQNAPLQAQYDIFASDVNLSKDAPRLLGSATLAGSTRLTVVTNAIFADGDMARAIAPQSQHCIMLPYAGNEKRIPAIDLASFPSLQSLSLVAVPPKPGEGPVNGVKVKHFHAEPADAKLKTVVDLYVTDDDQQTPIQLIASVTTIDQPDNRTNTPSPYQQYKVTIEYNLQAQNPTVSLVKPNGCTTVQAPAAPRPTVRPRATARK